MEAVELYSGGTRRGRTVRFTLRAGHGEEARLAVGFAQESSPVLHPLQVKVEPLLAAELRIWYSIDPELREWDAYAWGRTESSVLTRADMLSGTASVNEQFDYNIFGLRISAADAAAAEWEPLAEVRIWGSECWGVKGIAPYARGPGGR